MDPGGRPPISIETVNHLKLRERPSRRADNRLAPRTGRRGTCVGREVDPVNADLSLESTDANNNVPLVTLKLELHSLALRLANDYALSRRRCGARKNKLASCRAAPARC